MAMMMPEGWPMDTESLHAEFHLRILKNSVYELISEGLVGGKEHTVLSSTGRAQVFAYFISINNKYVNPCLEKGNYPQPGTMSHTHTHTHTHPTGV